MCGQSLNPELPHSLELLGRWDMYSHKEAIEEGWHGWSRQQRNSKLTTSIITAIVWVGGQSQGTQGQTLEDSKKVVPKCPSVMLQRLCV